MPAGTTSGIADRWPASRSIGISPGEVKASPPRDRAGHGPLLRRPRYRSARHVDPYGRNTGRRQRLRHTAPSGRTGTLTAIKIADPRRPKMTDVPCGMRNEVSPCE
ncbi:hypothetical protein ATSB10_14410 [Dyella thiooxydans]|uniref:Uncharacterized protein n=1 Tax=Dyella thiooxydans TaxID=445710 RepID=A0A161J2D8_9GAMM|nr:hypothetical protein ATSB10_14410 [Dyella thiooxydans]